MGTTWLEVAATVAEFMLPVFAGLLAWVSARVTAYIKAKVENTTYQGMLVRLTDTVLTLVREAEQTTVKACKAARDPASPGGAKLTAKEAEAIKATVVGKFKSLWGPEGIKLLMRVLGLRDGTFEEFISAKVEEAVHVEKRVP